MGDFIVGASVLLVGSAICCLGLRLWFITLPIWSFFAGFFIGADLVTAIAGDGFLSTVSSWIVGVAVGIGFALVAYYVWYAGQIIAAGSLGALLGSGLMAAVGVDSGWIVFLMAVLGAGVIAIAALALDIPKYLVAFSTALAGAAAVVAGLLLIFGRADLEHFDLGVAWTMIDDSWFWLIVWAVVAAVGLSAQMRGMAELDLPKNRWTRAGLNPSASSAA